MKKIKKESLKLEKEVIAHLTQDHLSQVVGGNGLTTTNSQYLCNSKINECDTNVEQCTLLPATNNAYTCGECISNETCKPIQPEISLPDCLAPGPSKYCGIVKH